MTTNDHMSLQNGSHEGPSSCTSIRAHSRKNRVYVFREFLIDTYGNNNDDCWLRPNNGGGTTMILDVAGGKGDLSWLLCNVDGLESVVLDPRLTTQCQHMVKSVQYLRTHPHHCHARAVPHQPTHQPLANLIDRLPRRQQHEFITPKHLRILVNQDLVDAVRLVRQTGDNEAWERFWSQAIMTGETANPMGGTRSTVRDSIHTTSHIVNGQEALNIILSARLVVGFHPDQATDACIDLAMVLNVPFVVVPCCVFPKEFPKRRVEGRTVRCYEDLIKYLNAKVACRTYNLSFHETTTARNIALYTLYSDIH